MGEHEADKRKQGAKGKVGNEGKTSSLESPVRSVKRAEIPRERTSLFSSK
ncbi:hypothetical protein TON_1549 [Thermococcus onnurineus NA1]|uniref:Uncharacterized protein n=1 Tax=Thermococcus onnurineus (strain NA1) TaxID=523850 RepID=B6YTU8_THEON|nr:hypothetical protein [Thermococcus onnurineus]ACJ17039.1 hypothetical protein TON_1549 [Thermococcus onnurineus NA1]